MKHRKQYNGKRKQGALCVGLFESDRTVFQEMGNILRNMQVQLFSLNLSPLLGLSLFHTSVNVFMDSFTGFM